MRQDLSTWERRHYHAPMGMRIKMFFGARRWRCEACRCNFVSFLGRKDKYVRPAERAQTPDATAERPESTLET